MNIALLSQIRRAGGGFVPFESLGPDPLVVRSDLDELENFGFALERHPYHGVAYRGPASRLCPDQIEWQLGTVVVGRRVAVWNRVGSTNDLAGRAAGNPANEGLVVLAEEQTAGRGRRGRVWSAPAGSSILMSVLLFPPIPLEDPAWLTALVAVATADALAGGDQPHGEGDGFQRPTDTPLDGRIKWPNDIRVDGRKVAGILVERGQGTVLGIGLNVNVADFPEDLRESATSLQRLIGRPLDRSEIVRSLIRRIDYCYRRAISHGPDWLGSYYRRFSEHYRHEVDVTTPSGIVSGRLGRLDLRMGLEVGNSHDDCRSIPAKDVLAIVNRAGSRRWTHRDHHVQWWHGSPDDGFRGGAEDDRTGPSPASES